MAGTPAPCQTRSVTRHRRFEFCFFASLAVAIAVEGAASFDHAARAEETRPSAAVDMTRLLEALGRHARDVRGLAEKGGQKSHLRYEELDGDGKASTWTETDFRRTDGKTTIVKSTKDGRDNTATAREEQQKRHAEEKKKKKKDEIGIPFEPNEQPKYSFSIAATDPLNPARVRIHFEPKGEPSDKTFIGEAWVDSVRGVMLMNTEFISLSTIDIPARQLFHSNMANKGVEAMVSSSVTRITILLCKEMRNARCRFHETSECQISVCVRNPIPPARIRTEITIRLAGLS